MTVSGRVPLTLLLLAILSWAAACTNGAESEEARGSVPPTDPASDGTSIGPIEVVKVNESTGSVDMDPTVAEAYETFTDTWLRFVDDADDDGATELAPLAVPEVLTFFENWRERNDAQVEEGDLRGTVAKSADIGLRSVEASDDLVVVEDCMRMVDFDTAGIESVYYFWQQTTLEQRDGEWIAAGFEVINTGEPSINLTCVSADTESLVTDLVLSYALAAAEARKDPSAGIGGSGIASLVGEDLASEWRVELNQAVAEGERWEQTETYEITVLGTDPSTLIPVVVVELCTVYPDGLTRWSGVGTELPVAEELGRKTRGRHVFEIPLEGSETFLLSRVREYQIGALCDA